MSDPHEQIAARFRELADALRSADTEAFASLCVLDAPAQTQLFERNSQRVQQSDLTLRLKHIAQEGEVAEVTFEVLKPDGDLVDEGTVTFTEERDGWRLRSL